MPVTPASQYDFTQWVGSRAEVWAYTVSHRQLAIHISRPAHSECIVVLMKNCSSVHFEPAWDHVDVRVEVASTGSIVISDGENLRIECGAAFVSSVLPDYTGIRAFLKDVGWA